MNLMTLRRRYSVSDMVGSRGGGGGARSGEGAVSETVSDGGIEVSAVGRVGSTKGAGAAVAVGGGSMKGADGGTGVLGARAAVVALIALRDPLRTRRTLPFTAPKIEDPGKERLLEVVDGFVAGGKEYPVGLGGTDIAGAEALRTSFAA